MATREEIKLKSYEKEVDEAQAWVEKADKYYENYFVYFKKLGLFQEIEGYWKDFVQTRKYYRYKYDNKDKPNQDKILRYFYAEEKKLDDILGDYSTWKTKDKNLYNKFYGGISKLSDYSSKYSKINTYSALADDLRPMVKQKQENMTTEQLKEQKQREMYKYVRSQINTLSFPSLDKWLETYRKGYLDWVDSRESKGQISYSEARFLKKDVDSVVLEQKITIIARSWEKVGKPVEILRATTGSDGGFNGIVRGQNGTCRVETILAGGYNIQRLHYRVLAHKLNDNKTTNVEVERKLKHTIFEINQSYPSSVTFLNDNSERVQVLKCSDFIKDHKLSKTKDIYCLTAFRYLNKKEKRTFFNILNKLAEDKERDFGVFVLNTSGKLISEQTEQPISCIESYKNI